jgi:hypothetical protein
MYLLWTQVVEGLVSLFRPLLMIAVERGLGSVDPWAITCWTIFVYVLTSRLGLYAVFLQAKRYSSFAQRLQSVADCGPSCQSPLKWSSQILKICRVGRSTPL